MGCNEGEKLDRCKHINRYHRGRPGWSLKLSVQSIAFMCPLLYLCSACLQASPPLVVQLHHHCDHKPSVDGLGWFGPWHSCCCISIHHMTFSVWIFLHKNGGGWWIQAGVAVAWSDRAVVEWFLSPSQCSAAQLKMRTPCYCCHVS